MLDSLLGGTNLNYVGHRAYICREIMGTRKERKHVDMAELARQNELSGGQEIYRLHRAPGNGARFSAVTHKNTGTELSQEELRDNICLRYWLMPQDIPATCDDCVKSFLMENALSCPKGGLVLSRHDYAAKEWRALGALALIPSDITYKPKINSRTVQGKRTGAGARQERGTADGGADIVGEDQGRGGSVWTVNMAAVLERRPGQVEVPAEYRE